MPDGNTFDALHGENGQLGLLDILAFTSFFIQLKNLDRNSKQLSNDDLMSELQRQNKKYLEKILENQNKILSLLEKFQT